MSNIKFPAYILPRKKGQRHDKQVTIDYNKVKVVGEYMGCFGWSMTPEPGELLLAEVDGMLYPCYRRKSNDHKVTTAIGQCSQFKACKIEDAVS